MKQFGEGGETVERGFNLATLIGLLEALVNDEEDNAHSGKPLKRLEIVEGALDKLQQADEM